MGKLRAYFFLNMYMSGIHAGIQAQHCTAEMFRKYDCIHCSLHDWADNDKTTILLNGGNQDNLRTILHYMVQSEYPHAHFRESKEALNSALTCIGIILPEKMFRYREWELPVAEVCDLEEYTHIASDGTPWHYTAEDLCLISEMSKLKLMA